MAKIDLLERQIDQCMAHLLVLIDRETIEKGRCVVTADQLDKVVTTYVGVDFGDSSERRIVKGVRP